MSPILTGVIASGISGNLWAPTGAYESIATTTVGAGGASSITFNSIPQGYTHLQIRAISRTTSTGQNVFFRFNGDANSNNYTLHQLYMISSPPLAYGTGTGLLSGAFLFYGASNSEGSNVFGGAVIDILDYTNTNKYKTGRGLSGYNNNGSGAAFLGSSLWLSTAAITSITVVSQTANLGEYSSFALYGIKGN
jgi:hypothetical protein